MYKQGDKVGSFELVTRMVDGGDEELWVARDQEHHANRETTLRLTTSSDSRAALKRESTDSTTIRNLHVIAGETRTTDESDVYQVLDFEGGLSLRTYLDQEGTLDLDDAVCLILQVLDALASAQNADRLHRRLSPDLIFLTVDPSSNRADTDHTCPGCASELPVVRIPWFGTGNVSEEFSTVMGSPGEARRESMEHLLKGYEYRAPEQKTVPVSATPATDLYACGTILYELVTGFLPSGSFPFPDLGGRKRTDGFGAVVWTALQPHPNDRYQRAEEMSEDLQRLLDNELPGTVDAFRQWKRRDGVVRTGEPNPGLRLRPGNEPVYNIEELVAMARVYPRGLASVLRGGELEVWLRRIKEKALSRFVRELRLSSLHPQVAVQKFLEATGRVSPPDLVVEPESIRPGTLHAGEEPEAELTVTADGEGILYGTCIVEGDGSWIRPEEQEFHGREDSLSFLLSTYGLEAGRTYMTYLNIMSNGGRKKVPVRFSLKEKPARPVFEPDHQELVIRPEATRVYSTVLINEGDKTLNGSIEADPSWVDVQSPERVDLKPGERVQVTYQVLEEDLEEHLERTEAKDMEKAAGTLAFRGGTQECSVRIDVFKPVPGNLLNVLWGFLLGFVPVFSELYVLLLLFRIMNQYRSENPSIQDRLRERKSFVDNVYWILGLLPGVILHLSWIF